MVGQLVYSFFSQAEDEEYLIQDKTEEEIRMQKYILENILESDESQHRNLSSSSSDTFYFIKAPNIPSFKLDYLLVQAACMRHTCWWTEAKLAIVFSLLFSFSFFLFLCLLLFTHLGETPNAEILFRQKKADFGHLICFLQPAF